MPLIISDYGEQDEQAAPEYRGGDVRHSDFPLAAGIFSNLPLYRSLIYAAEFFADIISLIRRYSPSAAPAFMPETRARASSSPPI